MPRFETDSLSNGKRFTFDDINARRSKAARPLDVGSMLENWREISLADAEVLAAAYP